jgi:hypothetical protein
MLHRGISWYIMLEVPLETTRLPLHADAVSAASSYREKFVDMVTSLEAKQQSHVPPHVMREAVIFAHKLALGEVELRPNELPTHLLDGHKRPLADRTTVEDVDAMRNDYLYANTTIKAVSYEHFDGKPKVRSLITN